MENYSGENSKDNFLFDTSALLSLESIRLLDVVLEWYCVVTTKSVLEELEEFAKHEDLLGIMAKKVLIKANRFVFKTVSSLEKIDYVGPVDKELFSISLKEDIVLITDDVKLMRHSVGKIKIAFSTFFLTDFIFLKIHTKTDALFKLEELRGIRNWQDNVIYLSTKEELEKIE